MASKKRRRHAASRPADGQPTGRPSPPRRGTTGGRDSLPIAAIVVILLALAVVVIVADITFTWLAGGQTQAAQTTPSTANPTSFGVVVQGRGGSWTNVTPDQLDQMLSRQEFTLLNVKTPYEGEIQGTDLYIPYDQLAARASELPADKGARIVVYCHSGNTSKIAAQTLLDLGYTDVWNLDGGMAAWVASGRQLVYVNR
jgi:rhodanese-related sulfurtransferase